MTIPRDAFVVVTRCDTVSMVFRETLISIERPRKLRHNPSSGETRHAKRPDSPLPGLDGHPAAFSMGTRQTFPGAISAETSTLGDAL